MIKNKLFFFADFQATRQSNGISNQETIPTNLLQSTCVTGGTYCDFGDYAAKIGNGKAGDLPITFMTPAQAPLQREQGACLLWRANVDSSCVLHRGQ